MARRGAEDDAAAGEVRRADRALARAAAGLLADWAGRGAVLVVLTEEQARVALSFRNLPRVSVLPATSVGIADLVGASRVLVTEDALSQLTARAKGERIAGAETDETDGGEDA